MYKVFFLISVILKFHGNSGHFKETVNHAAIQNFQMSLGEKNVQYGDYFYYAKVFKLML